MKGYYNKEKNVHDEDIKIDVGQEVIATILDTNINTDDISNIVGILPDTEKSLKDYRVERITE